MKKSFILAGILAIGYTNAQNNEETNPRIGINTITPKATLHIKETTITNADGSENVEYPQGVLFPKFSTEARSKFTNVMEGTLIYNTDKKCIELYLGNDQWDCAINAENVGNIASKVSISPSGFTGVYYQNISMVGNTVKFTIKNNSVAPISNIDFSNAVTATMGGTAVAIDRSDNTNVTINGGATKELIYKILGTATSGTLTATFNHLGLSASQSVNIGMGNASLQNAEHKVYTTAVGNVNGQSINNNNKISIQIPYTGGMGTHSGANIQATTSVGHNGDVNTLTLNIPAGTFASNGYLTATISVEGDGEYILRRIGDKQTYDIATFNLNLNGSTSTIKIIGYGLVDGASDANAIIHNGYHYIPINVNGLTILNHNLEAETAKMGSTYFNTSTQANYDRNISDKVKGFGTYYNSSNGVCPMGYRALEEAEYHQIKTILPLSGTGSATQAALYNDVGTKLNDNRVIFTNNGGAGASSILNSGTATIRCIKQ